MPVAFLLGIHFWGIAGVCVSWLVVYPIWFIFVLRQGLPKLGISLKQYLHKIAPPYVLGAIMVLIVWAVRWNLSIDRFSGLFLLVMIGAFVYAALSWGFIRNYVLNVFSALRLDRP